MEDSGERSATRPATTGGGMSLTPWWVYGERRKDIEQTEREVKLTDGVGAGEGWKEEGEGKECMTEAHPVGNEAKPFPNFSKVWCSYSMTVRRYLV